MSGNHMNRSNSPNSADWRFGNPSMSMDLPNSSNPMYQGIQPVAMAESFDPKPWSNPMNSQNSGFATNNIHIGKVVPLPSRLDMGIFLPNGILPSGLSDFPADSSFIERAAKFSSFSAAALMNAFGTTMPVDHGSRCESPMNIQRDSVSGQEETPDVANLSGDSSSKGLNAKKRKKSSQDVELDQVQEGSKFFGEVPKENVESKRSMECSSSTLPTVKFKGKNVKGATDETKQDYIHVRARRGQATNSHSLAERVRRERISERMKYLQDLVPGCSKVTGKAVMLDEIINYVQSLQRQVEFLSMKLATVNPSIDLNIEGLLSKDILQSRVGSSSGAFLLDLIHPQLVHSQPGLVQTGIPGMVNHPDALRRAINAQFTVMSGFKEPAPQMSNPWETELQNMVQMTFGSNASPYNQEFNDKPSDGFQQ